MVGGAVSVASTTSAASCVAYQRVLVLSAIALPPLQADEYFLRVIYIVRLHADLNLASIDYDALAQIDEWPGLPGIQRCGLGVEANIEQSEEPIARLSGGRHSCYCVTPG